LAENKAVQSQIVRLHGESTSAHSDNLFHELIPPKISKLSFYDCQVSRLIPAPDRGLHLDGMMASF
jgi:hypothetical protein